MREGGFKIVQFLLRDHFLMTSAFIRWFHTTHPSCQHEMKNLTPPTHLSAFVINKTKKNKIMIEIKRKNTAMEPCSIRHQKISESPPPTHLSVLSAWNEGFQTTYPPHRETVLRNGPQSKFSAKKTNSRTWQTIVQILCTIHSIMVKTVDTKNYG